MEEEEKFGLRLWGMIVFSGISPGLHEIRNLLWLFRRYRLFPPPGPALTLSSTAPITLFLRRVEDVTSLC